MWLREEGWGCGGYQAQGGRSLLPRLHAGLWVSDDLPAGGGAADVGGAPSIARPRQEAKAAAGRAENRQAGSDKLSGITAKNSPDSQDSDRVSRELKPLLWFTDDVCFALSLNLIIY